VASIKSNSGMDRRVSIGAPSPGSFKAENVWLRFLIQMAWNVKDFQVLGGPGWAASDRFDINAKAGSGANFEQMRPMLQALLEDRFRLVLHRETKDLPVYALLPAKGGIKASLAGGCAVQEPGVPAPAAVPGQKSPTFCGSMMTSPRGMNATAITMEQFATALANTMQRTVVDKTGFADKFDVHLEWTADQSTPGFWAPGLAPPLGTGLSTDGASIFTVIQEQLGVKLESTQDAVAILVIDHAEKPSAN
jgi:bla regulator protein blaR1